MVGVLKNSFKEAVDVHANNSISFTVEPLSNGSIFITIDHDAQSLDLSIDAKEASNTKLFIYNKADKSIDFNLHVDVQKDANVQMGLLDIQDAPFHWKQYVSLNESGANFEILSGQLCLKDQKKICDMEVRHIAGHTHGEIRNFAVLFDEGYYEMVANGNIEKGCSMAESHQATRVLTLGKNHTTKVIPLLLIDENEVKASHAMTIGQPDQDQLYYLQSRGLTTKQAIGLLSVGYFLPVLDLIDDPKLHDEIRTEMESKVGLYEH